MAEALAGVLGGERVEAHSAGSAPASEINPSTIEVLAELGLTPAGRHPTALEDLPPGPFDVVVTMGCGERCPGVAALRREDWQLPDPRHLGLDGFRQVRDQIRERVKELLGSLGVPRQAMPTR